MGKANRRAAPQFGRVGDQHHAARIGDDGLGCLDFAIIEIQERALFVDPLEEYRADFGGPLKPPAPVTAFRFKTSAKAKPKKTVKPPAAKAPETKPDPKVAALQKQLAGAKKKLEEAKAASAPTRKFEDRIYEIEDALKLAGQPV